MENCYLSNQSNIILQNELTDLSNNINVTIYYSLLLLSMALNNWDFDLSLCLYCVTSLSLENVDYPIFDSIIFFNKYKHDKCLCSFENVFLQSMFINKRGWQSLSVEFKGILTGIEFTLMKYYSHLLLWMRVNMKFNFKRLELLFDLCNRR